MASLETVFRAAWGVMRTNFVSIVVLTLAVNIPINAILEFVPLPEGAGLREWGDYFRLQRLLEFWIGTIGALGMVHITVEASRGVRLSIGEVFRRAFGDYGNGLWAQFLYGLVMLVGLVLLVVPGVAVGVYWCFALQAIVVRRCSGWRALEYSHGTIKGRWWRFFGRFAALGLLMIVGIVLLSLASGFLPDNFLLDLVKLVPRDLSISYFAICFTELYLLSEPGLVQTPTEGAAATT